ncbi:MAG: hypothetical protein PHE43_02660 [Candidatus Nanoarchaeia archaeon]|nr:hypothetical protein [Candidatus Nanoarchaeia archaeon]
MDKKRNVFILSSVFFVLLVLFGSFVLADLDTTNTAVTATLGSDGVNNMTKGGETELFKITIVHDGTGSLITNFNITLDEGNYSLLRFTNSAAATDELVIEGVAGLDWATFPNSTNSLSNVTYDSSGNQLDWSCSNFTSTIICSNNSASAALGSTNTTIILYLNMTATASAESASNIVVLTSTAVAAGITNTTSISIGIDGINPTVLTGSLNITDGNMTWVNSTANHFNGSLVLSGVSSDIRLLLTMTDAMNDVSAVWMSYNTTGIAETANNQGTIVFFTKTEPSMYTGTIPQSALSEGNNLSFSIFANDSVGNTANFNESAMAATVPGYVLINSSDVVTITLLNITDETNAVDYLSTNPVKYFKPYTSIIIDLEATGPFKDDTIYTYYTNNGTDLRSLNYVEAKETLKTVNSTGGATQHVTLAYNITFPSGVWNTSNVSYFVITLNQSAGCAGIEGYTTIFKDTFTVDGTAPAATITDPSDTSIDVSGSVTFTCEASDDLSGVSSYSWKLTKPDASTIIRASTTVSEKESVTWTNTDTQSAGTYTVTCYATDAVGNEGSTTSTFTASYGGSTSGTGGGGGGGSTTTTTTVDADLTTATSATFTSSQGSERTFSLGGTSTHKIRVSQVEDKKVTFIVSSNPVTLTLAVGESESVDIDGDGSKDIQVTLDGINNGIVEYTVEKLATESVSTSTPETEEGEEVIGGEETPTEGTESGSKIWLWIILAVIVVAIIVYFVIKRRD